MGLNQEVQSLLGAVSPGPEVSRQDRDPHLGVRRPVVMGQASKLTLGYSKEF